MNAFIEEELVTDQEIREMLHGSSNVTAEKKLEELRVLSNIGQALENLFIQCQACDGYREIESFAQNQLRSLQQEMHRIIHS